MIGMVGVGTTHNTERDDCHEKSIREYDQSVFGG